MNKTILTILLFSAALFAAEPQILKEDCRRPKKDLEGYIVLDAEGKVEYEDKDMPKDACAVLGYVCDLAVETYGAVVFKIGNKSCTSKATTSFSMTENPSNTLWITVMDDDNVSGLYVAAASSLILSVANNRELISVIYGQRKDLTPEQKTRRSVRLLSIGRPN